MINKMEFLKHIPTRDAQGKRHIGSQTYYPEHHKVRCEMCSWKGTANKLHKHKCPVCGSKSICDGVKQ